MGVNGKTQLAGTLAVLGFKKLELTIAFPCIFNKPTRFCHTIQENSPEYQHE
jgi:hypothetical protein